MKKIFFAVLLTIAATAASAQGVIVGVKGGLATPTLSPVNAGQNAGRDFSGKTGWGVGGFVELPVSEMFSVELGLDYNFATAEDNGNLYAFPTADMTGQFFDDLLGKLSGVEASAVTQRLPGILPKELYLTLVDRLEVSYLNLPVMAKFGWNLTETSPVRLYAGVGVYASYLMVAGQITSGHGQVYASASSQSFNDYWHSRRNSYTTIYSDQLLAALDHAFDEMDGVAKARIEESRTATDDFNALGFGVAAQAGVRVALGKRKQHLIFAEATYRQGLTTMQAASELGEDRLSTLGVSLGYGFRIGKK